MKFTHMLGIDISKDTLDLALMQNKANSSITNNKFSNNLKGYKALLAWLKEQHIALDQVLICLETTGIYHRCLVAFLQNYQAFVWVENAVTIKWSSALQRGKTDKIDAQRICLYAFRNQDKAQAYAAKDQALQKLADLLASRERLIEAKKLLSVPIKELQQTGLKQEAKYVEKSCKKTLESIEKEIKAIEEELEAIIAQNKELEANYSSVCSVPYVGKITAFHLLVATNNFTRFENAKQLASYGGIAPFPYQSGSSVRGKTQVHHMANKKIKRALHLCAVSSIRYAGEMRAYFDRKVREGKNKMSILNAIRNKLLHRIFACVRENRLYQLRQAA